MIEWNLGQEEEQSSDTRDKVLVIATKTLRDYASVRELAKHHICIETSLINLLKETPNQESNHNIQDNAQHITDSSSTLYNIPPQ